MSDETNWRALPDGATLRVGDRIEMNLLTPGGLITRAYRRVRPGPEAGTRLLDEDEDPRGVCTTPGHLHPTPTQPGARFVYHPINEGPCWAQWPDGPTP